MVHRLEHLAQVIAALGVDLHIPRGLELLAQRCVLEVLESGQPVGDRAHVAATLDVVLATQRIQPASVPAYLSDQQRQVDQREHVVDRVVMLRDAERPADHGPVRARVRVRDLLDRACRHTGVLLGALQWIGLDATGVVVVSGGGAMDELHVRKSAVDDLARHRVRQRDVAADVEAEPEVRKLGRRRAPRVHRDQARAAPNSLEDVVKEDGMRLARVRAPEDDEVGLLSLAIRRRSSPGSEHCRQTDD